MSIGFSFLTRFARTGSTVVQAISFDRVIHRSHWPKLRCDLPTDIKQWQHSEPFRKLHRQTWNIVLKHKMGLIGVGLLLASCGSSGPSCSTPQEQELVLKIVGDNKGKFSATAAVIVGQKEEALAQLSAPDPELARLQGEVNSTYEIYMNNADKSKDKELYSIVQSKRKALEDYTAQLESKKEAIFTNESAESVKYAISNIRLQSKDAATGAVQCKATLEASVPNANSTAQQEIAYTVEITADGAFYATVW